MKCWQGPPTPTIDAESTNTEQRSHDENSLPPRSSWPARAKSTESTDETGRTPARTSAEQATKQLVAIQILEKNQKLQDFTDFALAMLEPLLLSVWPYSCAWDGQSNLSPTYSAVYNYKQ